MSDRKAADNPAREVVFFEDGTGLLIDRERGVCRALGPEVPWEDEREQQQGGRAAQLIQETIVEPLFVLRSGCLVIVWTEESGNTRDLRLDEKETEALAKLLAARAQE